MIFALSLIISAGLLFLFHYVFGVASLPYGNKVASFMGGVALVGMILAIACFCLHLGKFKLYKKKKTIYVLWMIISIVAFLAFLSYIVVIIIDRANTVGITFCAG